MQVSEVMNTVVKSCSPDTTVAKAGVTMFEGDCGVLPITDDTKKLLGIVTDRDITVALCTRGKRADELTVQEITSNSPVTCRVEDDLRTALRKMADAQIRRIPVVSSGGRVEGGLSINDIILHAKVRGNGLSYADVMETLKAICSHREPVTA
ncbi:MAG: CBS domain-containing protein [Nitrospira sp. WS110]|nr:CBS domain-containing protein [Nitrospira sp. WS110]